ncbi:MAG: ubiquinone biosynthesis regulatory protein kinase UbiB [Gammaproteobacteria bacterium]|nr:ubiquinone biosynthesis regulatory protein kinase UbiB [Gammaproteobacteria bacterium]
MRSIRSLLHARRILATLLDHGLDELLDGTALSPRLKLARLALPGRRNRFPELSRGQRLRHALQELGPVFVKFGQMLSTRRDLLPADLAAELALLQDQVKPFPGEEALALVEARLGKPIAELFKHFDAQPLASASVAQVHAAVLPDGREVVVKVLRPGIAARIVRDMELLAVLAEWAERFLPDGKRLKPRELVADYDKTIHDELDLMREAANAATMRRLFEGGILYVPEVHWDFCDEQVMVMERVAGIPVDDIAALNAAGVDLKKLAERGVEIFFTQVFRDSFFHADMHPGNIFVDATDPKNPTYIGLDCGIVGSLSTADQRYLAENFLAFFERDYRRVAELHVQSGWVPAGTRVEDFEAAIRTVCEPIFGKPLAQISFAQFLIRLFATARRFEMEVQPQLVLLQKTLLYVEGLGRQLYPELDLWATARPFLKDWMHQRVGPRGVWKRIRQAAPFWAEKLPELPDLVYGRLKEIEGLRAGQEKLDRQLAEQRQDGRRRQRQWQGGVLLSALGLALAAGSGALPMLWAGLLALPLVGAWYLSRD